MGVPPTGKTVELWGISIVRAENGKLAECWDGYDALSLPRQLGIMP
jgi:predicted ester cyclase